MFDDYFSDSKRYSFMLAALGSNYSWQILPRYNVLTNLPSDFDVIRVNNFLCYQLILWIAIPGFRNSWLFSPILNPGIGGISKPGVRDYKKSLKLYFFTCQMIEIRILAIW